MTEIFNPSHYYFNHNSIAPVSVALMVFGISVYSFFKTKRDLPNITFIIFCLCVSMWLSGMALLYSTKNYAVAEAIFKYYVFFSVATMPPTFYFYTSSVLNLKKKWRFFLMHYIIALVFYFVNLKTDYIYLGMKEYSYGYYPIFTTFGSLSFLLYFYGNAIICFKNLIKNIKTIKSEDERNRVKDVAIGFIIGHISGIDYLPAIEYNIYPYGYIFVVIMITYLFSAKPWLGIKDELLLKQEEEETFIIDDNIDKNFSKLMAERGN